MTHKERMLAAIRRDKCDQIPFAPRMDLWYIANKAKGTLPPRFQNKNTVEIAKELEVACHAVRADYTIERPKEDSMFRGFGFDNHPDYPYRVELKGLPVSFEGDEENLKTLVRTAAGDIYVHLRISNEMKRDGISIPFVLSYPIRSFDDLEAVAIFFEHLEVIPTPDHYKAFQERVGDLGLAIANGFPVASPIHLMLHDLMPMDQFFYAYIDDPKRVKAFAKRLEPFFMQVLNVVLDSSCEAFLWGSNYDQSTTYPQFFKEEILPWLNIVVEKAQQAGKYVVSHTDGENDHLFALYKESGIHIAESVCPFPMTQNSLKEIRQKMGDKITIYGGIPAIALLPSSMNNNTFEKYLETLFEDEVGDGSGLILGVSDNVPPAAELSRIQSISKKIRDFGSVPKQV